MRATLLFAMLLCAVALCAACSSAAVTPDPNAALWAEACIRVSGCAPYAATADPLFACHASGFRTTVGGEPAQCALDAAECDAAVSCFGAGSAPSPCVGFDEPRCEGDVLRGCDSGRQLEVARDCAQDGLQCRVNDFGQAHCARVGECTEGMCDGDVPVHCFGGALVPWASCAPGRCVDEGGSPRCAGAGEACEAPVFRCDGDVAVSCRDGFLQREQCRPGACRTDDGARCVRTDECVTRCEGSALVLCVGADVETYECTDYGFETCVDSDGSVSCR